MNEASNNEELTSNEEKTAPPQRSWLRRHWMSVLLILGCSITLAFWLALRYTGDRTPYGTVLLFGPRWLYVLPWMLSGCFFLMVGRFAKAVFLITGWIALFHVLMLNVPVRSLMTGEGETIKVLTCNLGPAKSDPAGLERLIRTERPDVVMLQESLKNLRFQWPLGWTHHQVGGLMIASRFPMTFTEVEKRKRGPRPKPWHTTVVFAHLQTETRTICVAAVHLPTPRQGLIDFIEELDSGEDDSTSVLEQEIALRSRASGQVHDKVLIEGDVDIIAGDFNMLADSYIFRRDWSEYKNAFSYAGWGIGYTKYEKFEGHRVMGRIDHILVNPNYAVRRCWVGPHIGSDHRPLLAEIVLKGD